VGRFCHQEIFFFSASRSKGQMCSAGWGTTCRCSGSELRFGVLACSSVMAFKRNCCIHPTSRLNVISVLFEDVMMLNDQKSFRDWVVNARVDAKQRWRSIEPSGKRGMLSLVKHSTIIELSLRFCQSLPRYSGARSFSIACLTPNWFRSFDHLPQPVTG